MKNKFLILLLFVVFFYGIFLEYQSTVFATIATSTSFKTIQGIQSGGGGNATSTYATSTTFKQFGATGQAGVGISTSTNFKNHAGIISSIAKTKDGGDESFTFVIDSNSTSFGSVVPGTLSSGTSVLSVTTNNTSGFTIYGKRDDADTTLDLDTNAATNITDKTAWVPGANCASAGNATASTTESLTLQFRIKQAGTDSSNYCSAWWGTNDTTAGALFAGLPSSNKEIVYRSSAALSQSDSVILYNLNMPATHEVGDYSGNVTYTVLLTLSSINIIHSFKPNNDSI